VLTDGYGATCCTAPVIFASIGRRLGFPIYLVKGRIHLFCRWEDTRERFNIETTSKGYYRHADEYYHTWPKPISMKRVHQGILLQNLTRREELGLYLEERGVCFMENLMPAQAAKAGHSIRYIEFWQRRVVRRGGQRVP